MNKNIKLIINYLLGPLLFIILSWSLYRQIANQADLEVRWQQIKFSWVDANFWIVVFLMFVNWGFEAAKWRKLIAPLEIFSFCKAMKSVFAGCSITMLTPNRIGEFGGRIMYVQEHHRLKAISLTILGSISQFAVTMIMGTIGLLYLLYSLSGALLKHTYPWLFNWVILLSVVSFTVMWMMFYFKANFFLSIIGKINFFKKALKYVQVVESFGGKQLLRILFLSFLRYMVFILQYVLLLKVMHVDLTFILSFWLLTVFYLIMVIAPTIGFTELPVRATTSVALFGVFSNNVLGIQAAAFGIWLINLVIPAVIGSVLILGIKIMKER